MSRRELSYYLIVTEAESTNRIGIIVDISPQGFRLESQKPIPPGQIRRFRIDLSTGNGTLKSLMFVGRGKWYQPDYIDPTIYIVGFELTDMPPEDVRSYQRVFEEYSKQPEISGYNRNLYPWR
jgi:hypothetical protein